MITINNYLETVKGIDLSKLDKTLQEAHEFFLEVTENGTNFEYYNQDETIRESLDLHFQQIGDWMANNSPKPTQTKEVKVKESKPKQTVKNPASLRKTVKTQPHKTTKPSVAPGKVADDEYQKKTAHRTQPAQLRIARRKVVNVARISEELMFINRYVSMHKKVKSLNQIRLFIIALQKAITERRIRDKSPYANEVMEIQRHLVQLHNDATTEVFEVQIDDNRLAHLYALVGKQELMQSVRLIKSFIGLQGRDIDNQQAKSLHNRIAKLINGKKIKKSDPYFDKLLVIIDKLAAFVKKNPSSGKVLISNSELSGLRSAIDSFDYPNSGNLNGIDPDGIISSVDLVNLQFDKLNFKGKWLDFIGNPSPGFSALIYGRAKYGKSTLAMDFAGYLARNHGRVLYVSQEEGISDTVGERIARINMAHPNLDVSGSINYLSHDYDFVFLDSINSLQLKPDQIEQLRKKFPRTSFILISHVTHSGNSRGAYTLQHLPSIIIEVYEMGRARQRGRYSQGGEMKIF